MISKDNSLHSMLEFGSHKIVYAPAGPVATNVYLLLNTETKKIAAFDAPLQSIDFFQSVIEQTGYELTDIYLTHSHWDHFGDAQQLREQTNCKIWVNKLDEYRLLKPNDYLGFPIPIQLAVTKPDSYLPTEGVITILGLDMELLHVPGHTEGSICFYNEQNRFAIVGDTIFEGSIGRTDLHGGDTNTLLTSIREKLLLLPDETLLMPGHGSNTTVGKEKATNPFVGDKSQMFRNL